MVNSRSGFVLTEKSVNVYLLFNLFFEESLLSWLGHRICGSFFIWFSTSCSQFIIKKLSNGNFFIQNDEEFIKTTSLVSQYSFWVRKAVIWLLLMTTWEREVESQRKKKPQIPSLIHQFYIYITLSSDTTTYLGLLRHRGYCFYIEVFCWFGLGNPQFLPCLLPFRERLYPSKYFELVLQLQVPKYFELVLQFCTNAEFF